MKWENFARQMQWCHLYIPNPYNLVYISGQSRASKTMQNDGGSIICSAWLRSYDLFMLTVILYVTCVHTLLHMRYFVLNCWFFYVLSLNCFGLQVLEAVGPIIFLSTDTKKLRNEGFLSPFHPRYPDILTNSAHPMVSTELLHWYWLEMNTCTFLVWPNTIMVFKFES